MKLVHVKTIVLFKYCEVKLVITNLLMNICALQYPSQNDNT